MNISKIGFQTSRYNGLSLDAELNFAFKNKVGYFEFFFDGFLPQDLKKNEINAIKKFSKNFIYTVHCPIASYFDYPIFLDAIIDFSFKIEAKIITIHFDKLSIGTAEKIYGKLDDKIIFSIENTTVDFNNIHKLTYLNFMNTATKNLKLAATFDAGHALLSSGNYIAFLNSLLENSISISEIHAHNNDGKADNHSQLNCGIIDFKKIFLLLNNKGLTVPFIIEHWQNNTSSLDVLKTLKNYR